MPLSAVECTLVLVILWQRFFRIELSLEEITVVETAFKRPPDAVFPAAHVPSEWFLVVVPLWVVGGHPEPWSECFLVERMAILRRVAVLEILAKGARGARGTMSFWMIGPFCKLS